MAGDEVKPLSGEFFQLDFKGLESDLKFTSCSLPSGTVKSVDCHYINGQAKSDSAKLPHGIDWSDIVAVRALDEKGSFWDWIKQGIPAEGGGTGTVEKKELALHLCKADGGVVRTWSLTGAFPTSYAGSAQLDAGSSEICIESLSIHFDHCKIT